MVSGDPINGDDQIIDDDALPELSRQDEHANSPGADTPGSPGSTYLTLPSSSVMRSKIWLGSAIRPVPVVPQLSQPSPGSTKCTPSALSWARLRCTAGLAHMSLFIAGAASTGPVKARYSVESRSSARPCANLARQSALAGATTSNCARRARPMCSPSGCSRGEKSLVCTGRFVSASNVVAPMNFCAARVITTETEAPACTSRLASSADLYAAIPP